MTLSLWKQDSPPQSTFAPDPPQLNWTHRPLPDPPPHKLDLQPQYGIRPTIAHRPNPHSPQSTFAPDPPQLNWTHRPLPDPPHTNWTYSPNTGFPPHRPNPHSPQSTFAPIRPTPVKLDAPPLSRSVIKLEKINLT